MCGMSSNSLQRAHPGFGAIIRGEPFGNARRHQHCGFAQLLDDAHFHERTARFGFDRGFKLPLRGAGVIALGHSPKCHDSLGASRQACKDAS
jgi:hypothetical protein